jgi:hypothetical protein
LILIWRSALLDGSHNIAEFEIPGRSGKQSVHDDVLTAKGTIEKLREMELDLGVHIALAHDESWMLKGTDSVLMSLLNKHMVEFVENRLARQGIP